MGKTLNERLQHASPQFFSAYCIVAAFGTYFCMYAFRKPFTAATFAGSEFYGLDYKTVLVVSQVLGYTLSKFIGIRVIAEFPAARRAWGIVLLIAISHAALLVFGIVPRPYNFIFLFINGLPLGMVFGLVLAYLEGRRVTEVLSAGLCASFIVSSGVVKSVGQSLILYAGIAETWMPFVAGLFFWPPLLAFVWLLAQIPPPSKTDVELRAPREPIYRADRQQLLRRHGLGLVLLVVVYTLLTVLRSVRDDFGVEIWAGLGYAETPSIFALSETVVMFVVIVVNGAAFLILDNRTAFFVALQTLLLGFILAAATTLLFLQNSITGVAFMVILGVGTYAPYVAFHTTLFERMIALFRDRANIGYLMYLADAFGYLGYVGVLVVRNFVPMEVDFLRLMILTSLVVSGASILLVAGAYAYFKWKLPRTDAEEPLVEFG